MQHFQLSTKGSFRTTAGSDILHRWSCLANGILLFFCSNLPVPAFDILVWTAELCRARLYSPQSVENVPYVVQAHWTLRANGFHYMFFLQKVYLPRLGLQVTEFSVQECLHRRQCETCSKEYWTFPNKHAFIGVVDPLLIGEYGNAE